MKKVLFATLIAAFVLSPVSCKKNDMALVKGDYSYRMGGYLDVEEIVESESTADPRSSTVNLTSERGQMQIIEKDKDIVIVTLSSISGSVWSFEATIDGETLTIIPFERNLIYTGGSSIVRMSGSGKRIGENIVFEVICEGNITLVEVEKRTYFIKESNITFFASRI